MILGVITLRSMETVRLIRRTISIPNSVDDLIREAAEPDESYSATVARLVESGARAEGRRPRLAWIGMGEGPEDLSVRAEHYLRELMRENDD
jgi:hypothetical protein